MSVAGDEPRTIVPGGRRAQRGFILIETLVGIAIIGTTVLAGLVALSTASIASRQVSEATQSAVLAVSQIELIKTEPYVPTGNAYPSISAPAGYTVTNSTSPYPGGNQNFQYVTVQVLFDGEVIREQNMVKINR